MEGKLDFTCQVPTNEHARGPLQVRRAAELTTVEGRYKRRAARCRESGRYTDTHTLTLAPSPHSQANLYTPARHPHYLTLLRGVTGKRTDSQSWSLA